MMRNVLQLDSRRIAILGDIHIGLNENQPHYLDYQFNSIEYHLKQVSQFTKNVVFLGDLLHNRKTISQVTLNLIKNRFKPLLKKYNIEPILITGNHDVYYKSSNELCSLDFLFEGYQIVVDDCLPLTFNNKEVGMCVPWINKDNSAKLIEQFKSTKGQYLFGHFEISGHDILPGIKCLHSQFDPENLMRFKEVISGHFHCSSRHANISYLGAPFEMNWADSENTKQSMVLNFSTGEEKFFKNPATFFDKINIIDHNFPDIEQYANKNLKVYLNTKRTIAIEKFINSLTEIANSCNIIDNAALLENNDAEISISKKMGILDIWQEYIGQSSYDKNDRDELTKIFTETYNSVLMETVL